VPIKIPGSYDHRKKLTASSLRSVGHGDAIIVGAHEPAIISSVSGVFVNKAALLFALKGIDEGDALDLAGVLLNDNMTLRHLCKACAITC
jgi:hypothetical protein